MPPKKQIFKNTGRYTIQKKENIKKKKKKILSDFWEGQ